MEASSVTEKEKGLLGGFYRLRLLLPPRRLRLLLPVLRARDLELRLRVVLLFARLPVVLRFAFPLTRRSLPA